MKIRNGFVSNSSSSSFMIYGYQMNYGNFKQKCLEKYKDVFKKEFNNLDEVTKEKYETLEEALDNYDLKFSDIIETKTDCPFYMVDEESNLAFLGRNPKHMSDNETMDKFKKDINEQINKFLDTQIKCEWIYYNYYC